MSHATLVLLALAIPASLGAATPALGAWETTLDVESVSAVAFDGPRRLELYCEAGGGLALALGGPPVPGVPGDAGATIGLMLWISLPDGRTHREPVDVTLFTENEAYLPVTLSGGPVWYGEVLVGSLFREFFAGAAGMEIDFPAHGAAPVGRFDMTGSARAMAAIAETCGI